MGQARAPLGGPISAKDSRKHGTHEEKLPAEDHLIRCRVGTPFIAPASIFLHWASKETWVD